MPRHLRGTESRYDSQGASKKAMLQSQTLNNKSDFLEPSHSLKQHDNAATSKKRIKEKFGSIALADYTSGSQTINKAKMIHRRSKYNQSALSTIGARPIKENPKIQALALETVTTSSDHINHISSARNEKSHSKQKPGVKTMTEGIYDESPHRLASTRHKNMRVMARAQKPQTKRKKLGHSQRKGTLPLHDSLGSADPNSMETQPFVQEEDLNKAQ